MMFYPDIYRRPSYKRKKNGDYYSSYSEYYSEILADCLERCVYCDIELTESGGEGFQLDHFKPTNTLKDNSPSNLVISCSKCNRLKSAHWPNDPALGIDGFLDPFTLGRSSHSTIRADGTLKDESLVMGLQIKYMQLNRPARVLMRKRRLQRSRANKLNLAIKERLGLMIRENDLRMMTETEKNAELKRIHLIMDLMQKLRSL
jgi:hypothetical protein